MTNHDNAEGRVRMPFYIILDLSWSMREDFVTMQSALQQLVHGVGRDFVASSYAVLSVIGFGSDAETLIPLGSASEIQVPAIERDMGGTDYSAAFAEFKRAFDEDRRRMKAQGDRVYRPCVFFLTDGEPNSGSWKADFDRDLGYDPRSQTGNRAYPFVVAYGFRDAPEGVLRQLAYPNFGEKQGRWYYTKSSDVAAIMQSIIPMIAQSVVSSGQSAAEGQPEIIMPDVRPLPGGTAGLPDELD